MMIFVSSLVDTRVWLKPSARMIDVSSFLGQENIVTSFISARVLESQHACCQERQSWRSSKLLWPARMTYPRYAFCMQEQQIGRGAVLPGLSFFTQEQHLLHLFFSFSHWSSFYGSYILLWHFWIKILIWIWIW